MRHIRVFLIVFNVYLMLYISNGEICPAQCICKKVKSQLTTLGESYKAQCGGMNHKLNSIDELDLSTLSNELVQLNLSSNSISSLSSNLKLPVLQKLDLSKNKLTSIQRDVLKNLPNLRRLDLSSNSLKHVDKGWFGGLGNLEKLKLSGNLITTIPRGSFDELTSLKQLDISSNPLTCDCELFWLIDWLQNTSVKLSTPPKCASPDSFKGQLLRKLKIGVAVHCRSPVGVREPTEIELKPGKNQVIYEGDNIKIRCRAPSVTADISHGSEEPYSTARIVWRFNLEDPNEKFREIKVENRYLDDSGMVDSVLNIGIVSRNHTGQWTCQLVSEKGNHSKSISFFVISIDTKYCNSSVTTNNKGTYYWPQTITDNIVEQRCLGQQLSGLYRPTQAVRYCSEYGTWKELNTTACPYISETTKILEQFSKVNLNLTKGNLLESVRHLKNYTTDGKLLKDKMDIVYISRTIENYITFVKQERELGGNLIDIVNSLLKLNKKLLEDAQTKDKACSRLVQAVERISEFSPSPQLPKSNLAVDEFRVKPENFNGLTCAWYSNNQKGRTNRPFYCSTSTSLPPYITVEEDLIEASIQIPASLFSQLEQQGYSTTMILQLIVGMYSNANFFPTYQMKEVITSCVIGASLVGINVRNLTDPVTVMFRYPLLQNVDTPVLAWWDMELNDGIGGWNKYGCELSHYLHESLIFSCDRLSYFGMLQDIQYVPSSYITGAKFELSHPAIYAGTLVLILCLFITIVSYLLCYNSIQMAKRAKHSLINTWIAICLLVYLFCFGIYQTEDYEVCQIIGIVLHYLSLSVLLWMCVTVTTMYKRISKTDCIHLPEDELPPDQPIQKPILGLYLVGWGIALIVCGISGAVNMREYASHTYCFLYSGPALSAVFVPAFILVVFIVVCTLMIRCAIRCSDVHGQLSEGTQATENVDLDLLEPNLPNISIDRHSFRSISSRTASSNIEDPEHCPNTQLKAHIIVLVFYIFLWIFAALSARRAFKNILPYDEHIFSVLYAFMASMLGAFVLFFYGIARSDVRSRWTHVKRIWCRTRSISDTNMNLQQNLPQSLATNPMQSVAQPTATSAAGLAAEINNSRSSSRTSSHTKSHNSNVLKAAVDLNSIHLNDPDAEAKIANVNLVVLHRQQYRTNNTIPIYNDNASQGAEMFYNPHQSTVARKFFKKQRKNMVKHNNLGTRRRVDGGATTDNTSIISGNNRNSLPRLPKANTNINSNNIFGSGTKVNNTNIHVEPIKEMKQQNKNILSDSGDESEILIDHVTGSVNRLLAERESLRAVHPLRYTRNNDGSPKKSISQNELEKAVDRNVLQHSMYNSDFSKTDPPIEHTMRTVSQQCSLEYSSESPPEMNDTDPDNLEYDPQDDDLDATLKDVPIDQDALCEDNLNVEVDIVTNLDESLDQVNMECLLPENNEGMYTMADLSQNIASESGDAIYTDYDTFQQTDFECINSNSETPFNSEKAESVHSHVLYPQMPRAIYENPLHSHLHDGSGSNTTLDSEVLFTRYQPSEISAVQSIASDCDDCDHTPERSRSDTMQSPVSSSEIDAIYEQINRSRHSRRPSYIHEGRRTSPILYPPSTSFESGLNDLEINTDFRLNTQGIVASSSKLSNVSDNDSGDIKKETTV